MKIRILISKILIVITFFSTIIFSSCSDDSNPTSPAVTPNVDGMIRLSSAWAEGAQANVIIYVEDTLHQGYNPVHIVLYDSLTGALITNSHVSFDIVNHGNNVPVENPEEDAVGGIFTGAFILNGTQSGDNNLHFHYHVIVHNHQAPGEPEGEAEFGDFRVIANPDGFKSIIMSDSTKLYLSMVSPENPVTGMNDFQFVINRNEPQLFPQDGSYTITMNPRFLADNHTTSNNVNPVAVSNVTNPGHYKGKVNFDMSGLWRININVSKNGISYDTYFDVNY